MKYRHLLLAAMMTCTMTAGAQPYEYESVKGDPLKARIYTLKNGLRVYLTHNPDQPRIQTYIAVRAGGKNDPHESTGLAHYLEHLMFKGTSSFGTQDFAAERPILQQIQQQYEVYARTTDTDSRRAIYHVIDSLSHEASRHAIANEYDKLMAGIGSNGSNAYTSEDVTCYVEDIPANEVDRWARVQSDRFQDMVIRGFHTELEAVYEEYNIGLTQDTRKVLEELDRILYPHHPYGQQTVIGTQEHLKNPSLQNVLNYYHTYYVPNNVAVCMSGDMANMDSIVGIIDHRFGAWKPNPHLPALTYTPEPEMKAPVQREVLGRETDALYLAWRMPGQKDVKAYDCLRIVDAILSNSRAGLLDLDVVQAQRMKQCGSTVIGRTDYSALLMYGQPKEGQTLEQARQIILDEVEKLRRGEWDEKLLQAIVNNMKLDHMHAMQDNESRADMFVESFVNGIAWHDKVQELERLSRISKADVVRFVQQHMGAGYACVMKRQGEDPNEKKIDKPQISPIEMNRDRQSRFVTDLLQTPVAPVQPVFVDFDRDISRQVLGNGNELLYRRNTDDATFRLSFVADRGSKADRRLPVASSYINYLGTARMDAGQLQKELYRLACDVSIRVGTDRTYITVSGLDENMQQALKLCEEWIYGARPDAEVYGALVEDILKDRQDSKLEQKANFSRLVAYGTYGTDNPSTHIMSEQELKAADPLQILQSLRDLQQVHQTITYYGPRDAKRVKAMVNKLHRMARNPMPAAADNHFVRQQVTENEVILAPYDAKNIYMRSYSNDGQPYDPALTPSIDLYNEYFGGGMNGVVFQELRESRGLAYSASADYSEPAYEHDTNTFGTYIITQNDKMADCIDVFHQIVEQMPQSEQAFPLAKDAIMKRLATERVIRGQVLNYYINCRDLGLTTDPSQMVYQRLSTMQLPDLVRFQQQNVRGRRYRYLILGDEKELDMDKLRTLGPIRRVSTEEIFGY